MSHPIVLALLVLVCACQCGPSRPLPEAILGEWEVLCRTDSESKATCLGKENDGLYKHFLPGGQLVSTWSTRSAAPSAIRRPMHDGQHPRPLHAKGTLSSSPHLRRVLHRGDTERWVEGLIAARLSIDRVSRAVGAGSILTCQRREGRCQNLPRVFGEAAADTALRARLIATGTSKGRTALRQVRDDGGARQRPRPPAGPRAASFSPLLEHLQKLHGESLWPQQPARMSARELGEGHVKSRRELCGAVIGRGVAGRRSAGGDDPCRDGFQGRQIEPMVADAGRIGGEEEVQVGRELWRGLRQHDIRLTVRVIGGCESCEFLKRSAWALTAERAQDLRHDAPRLALLGVRQQLPGGRLVRHENLHLLRMLSRQVQSDQGANAAAEHPRRCRCDRRKQSVRVVGMRKHRRRLRIGVDRAPRQAPTIIGQYGVVIAEMVAHQIRRVGVAMPP